MTETKNVSRKKELYNKERIEFILKVVEVKAQEEGMMWEVVVMEVMEVKAQEEGMMWEVKMTME